MPTVRTPASTFFTEDKGKVRLITTANIASLNDELTHDSIALKDGDLVCCANQTDTAENGIWVVKDGANWVRASNARYAENLINGCRVTATEGTHAGRDAVLSVPYPTTALREEYDDTGGAALAFTIDASSGEEVRGPSPSSSTNNAIARWDTNTGRLIQDSEVIVADGDGTGNLTLSPATALGSAFITLPEDTDNGTEALTIRPAAALASSETLTLDFDGSVTIAGGSNATVDLDALDSNNIAAGGVNEDRLAANSLTGLVAANLANDATTPGMLLCHPIAVAGGADSNASVTIDYKFRVLECKFIANAAPTAGSDFLLDDGATWVASSSNAGAVVDISAGSDAQLFQASHVNDATQEIAASGTLRFVWTSTGGDFPAGTAYVYGFRVA